MEKVQVDLKKGSQKNNEHEQNPVCIMDYTLDFVHGLLFSSDNFLNCPYQASERQKHHLSSKNY